MKTRQEYNFMILDKLKELFTCYPDLRFCQGLINLEIIQTQNGFVDGENVISIKDPFYEESKITLNKVLSKWN